MTILKTENLSSFNSISTKDESELFHLEEIMENSMALKQQGDFRPISPVIREELE